MNKNLSCELIGFHLNADIAKDIKESDELFNSLSMVGASDQTTTNNSDENAKAKNLETNIKTTIVDILARYHH